MPGVSPSASADIKTKKGPHRCGPSCFSGGAGDLTRHQHPNRFQSQRSLVEHRQTLLALFAQGNQFAVTYGRVDCLQRGQARQFFVGIGRQATLRLGNALGVTREDFLFAGVDPWRQLITLGLDELVGAGTRYAFQLIVQGFERHPAPTGRCHWHRAGSAGRPAAGNGPVAASAAQPLR